jgi:hypothetical protein
LGFEPKFAPLSQHIYHFRGILVAKNLQPEHG